MLCSCGVQAPIKSGTIDPYTRVADHGRENIHGRTLFVFSIYDSYNHEDKLKFGAFSSEEAAKWQEAFKEAAEQVPLLFLYSRIVQTADRFLEQLIDMLLNLPSIDFLEISIHRI